MTRSESQASGPEASGPRAGEPASPKTPTARRHGRFRRGQIRLSLGTQVFIKKGLRPFDLHDPYYFAVSLSWRKFVLLFLACELAINAFFAALYSLQPGSVSNQHSFALVSNFFFSLETLATVGYGEMYPATTYGHLVSSCEIMVGVIFTAIVTGLLFVRFSRPRAKVRYADNSLVTRHNGRPTLMLRIGNARNTLLYDTRFTLHALVRNVSEEGFRHVSVVELPLLRPHLPVFPVLHMVMHVIDEASPLHGIEAGSPDIAEQRFFLSLTARDPVIGSQVTDMHIFEGGEILFGMRYADAINATGSKIIADYALLSAVVPDGGLEPVGDGVGTT